MSEQESIVSPWGGQTFADVVPLEGIWRRRAERAREQAAGLRARSGELKSEDLVPDGLGWVSQAQHLRRELSNGQHLRRELSNAQQMRRLADEALDRCRGQISRLGAELDGARAQLAILAEQLETAQRRNAETEAELAHTNAELQEMNKELQAMADRSSATE